MSRCIEKEQDIEKVVRDSAGMIALFYASWCPFCRAFLPVFEKHAAKDERRFCRILTDDMASCEDTYAIDVVPTVLFFRNGAVVKRLDGVPGRGLTEQQLTALIADCHD